MGDHADRAVARQNCRSPGSMHDLRELILGVTDRAVDAFSDAKQPPARIPLRRPVQPVPFSNPV